MRDLLKGRKFQTWLYSVSHGSLLLRSPATNEFPKNVDIVFVGVEYMSIPRHFHEILICEPGHDEMELLRSMVGENLKNEEIKVLFDSGKRYLVVSSGMKIEENDLDLFEYSFDLGARDAL